ARHHAHAQGIAEFAITVPALMGAVITIIGTGFWLYTQLVAAGAAQEGARVAARELATAADGQQAAERFLSNSLGPSAAEIPVRVTEDADIVVVEVVGQFPVSVMLGRAVGVPLHVTARMPREHFRPGGGS